MTDTDLERCQLAEQLKHYHDLNFTKGVYEHSIFGRAAKKLEAYTLEIPVKVRQTIYLQHEPWRDEVLIEPYEVTSILISQNKKGIWTKKFRANWLYNGRVTTISQDIEFDEIGESAFFAKEDAERLLLDGR